MIVNKCYDTIIVLYLSTILTEKGLNKNMKIKPELNENRVLECLKLKSRKISTAVETPPEPTPFRGSNGNFFPTHLDMLTLEL
mgnify:CR=1 FL=1